MADHGAAPHTDHGAAPHNEHGVAPHTDHAAAAPHIVQGAADHGAAVHKHRASRRLPDGAKEILQDFVVAVLRNKVDHDHFIRFAAEWFQKLFVEDEKKRTDGGTTNTPHTPAAGADPAKQSILPDSGPKKSAAKPDHHAEPPHQEPPHQEPSHQEPAKQSILRDSGQKKSDVSPVHPADHQEPAHQEPPKQSIPHDSGKKSEVKPDHPVDHHVPEAPHQEPAGHHEDQVQAHSVEETPVADAHNHQADHDAHQRAPSASQQKPPSMSQQKPPSMSQAPSADHQKAPSISQQKQPSVDQGHQKPASMSQQKQPSMDQHNAPPLDHQELPPTDQEVAQSTDPSHPHSPSMSQQKPHSMSQEPPSADHQKPSSMSHEKAPSISADHQKAPSMSQQKQPSVDQGHHDQKPPSISQEHPPSADHQKPPSMSQQKPPSMSQQKPPSMDHGLAAEGHEPGAPPHGDPSHIFASNSPHTNQHTTEPHPQDEHHQQEDQPPQSTEEQPANHEEHHVSPSEEHQPHEESHSEPDKSHEGQEDKKLSQSSIIRRQGVSAESYDPAAAAQEPVEVKSIPKTEEQLQRVKEAVRKVLLFESLDNEHLDKIIDALEERVVQPGEDIITIGDEKAESFYVIEEGNYDVFLLENNEPVKKHEYTGSGSFGELALMYNQPRAATVTATTPGRLWALDRGTFKRIVVLGGYQKRELYMRLMNKVDFLADLTPYQKENLCDALEPKSYAARDVVIHQGDHGDGMYFVEAGEVSCTRVEAGDAPDHIREISRVGPGGYVGELALIAGQPRAATVTAMEDSKLAFLDTAAFDRLLGPCKHILEKNIEKYRDRLSSVFSSNEAATP